MSRKRFYLIGAIVVFIAASLLISLLVWRRWVSQDAVIEREQAIQNAIQACNPTYGLQPVEQPTVFEAQLTTLRSAMDPYNPDPDRQVWLVKLKGRWLHVSGGPLPSEDSNPEHSYWDECTIVIDAQTGNTLTPPIQYRTRCTEIIFKTQNLGMAKNTQHSVPRTAGTRRVFWRCFRT